MLRADWVRCFFPLAFREKTSEALGRLALWEGSTQVAHLPQYLTVQQVRSAASLGVPGTSHRLAKDCKAAASIGFARVHRTITQTKTRDKAP